MINGNGTFSGYVRIRFGVGLYFIFVACAGISIIVWVFNWICWLNQCCCCDFLHNPVNKRIAWWMSFIFLLGILACCIAGCVSVNRFGFALEGARCALDRIYYDSVNGQLKIDEPKWKGFSKLSGLIDSLRTFINTAKGFSSQNIPWKDYSKTIEQDNNYKTITDKMINFFDNIKPERLTLPDPHQLNTLFTNEKTEFGTLNEKFLKDCYHYQNILKRCMQILAMIYFCLLIITVTFACVSLMFYACLKRQGYLITLMHILWNVIRFFMVSFFIFGTAYGIFDLALTDSISLIQYLFSKEFLKYEKQTILPKNSDYLKNCLEETDYSYKYYIDEDIRKYTLEFFYHYRELIKLLNKENEDSAIKKYFLCLKETGTTTTTAPPTLCSTLGWEYLATNVSNKGNFFDSFNCGFLKSDFNILYQALYDAATESENLAAISLCASFFGAVAVYFYLLVLHHYNNEMFFDSGKSIFKGFDGYGGGFKKKNIQQDPAYKKRKLRAEIELTSKNDEASGYNKDINKNDDEE